MAAFWLGLAMYSAYRIARGLGATRLHSVVGSTAWISTPIVWAHAGYSMVSLGISLLPFYFLAAIKLFLIESPTTHFTPKTVALYFAATILSVFMDGYTFMMFAVGASILLLYSLIMRPEIRTTRSEEHTSELQSLMRISY